MIMEDARGGGLGWRMELGGGGWKYYIPQSDDELCNNISWKGSEHDHHRVDEIKPNSAPHDVLRMGSELGWGVGIF